VQQNSIFHVAHAIESAITHLTLNHDQRRLLQQELAKFWESRSTKTAAYTELKVLPYLTACIQEGLRLGAASLKRSPRIFPDDEIEYNHWVIPRGVSGSFGADESQPDKRIMPLMMVLPR
jgi:cytochrome P450